MMRIALNRLVALVSVAGIAMCGSASAEVLIADFNNNFNMLPGYASWGNAGITTITPGANSWTVESIGFGGAPSDINPNVNGSGETHLELDFTVNVNSAGALVVLSDDDGSEAVYGWFGRPVGNHVENLPLNSPTFLGQPGSTPGLDLSTLSFFHLQVDPGANTGIYDVSFNNLRLYTPVIPEPASIALLASGVAGIVLTARRRR